MDVKTTELEAENAALKARLAASEIRAMGLVAQSMFSVQLLDPDGRTRYVNPAWERLWGMDLSVLEAMGYNMLLDPQLEAQGIAPYIRRGFAGEACAIPVILYDPAQVGLPGTPRYVAGYIYPVIDASGAVTEVVVMHQDVTDRVEAERSLADTNQRLQAINRDIEETVRSRTQELHEANARLRETDRYKDEFLSVISHELRTPLNFITGFASILDDGVDGPLNATQRQHVQRILNGSDRMLLLVNDLLDFAKLHSGKFELSPEPTPYAALVEEAIALMHPLAAPKGIFPTMSLSLQGRVPVIDGPRVTQVLTNLLSNAVKFTGEGGSVAVRASVEGDRLVTEVTDTGVGIRPEDMSRLFQRFQQLEMGNARSAAGTGLGLAISKALVEAHGGDIGVTSTPGVGSTFWFSLPIGD